MKTNMLQNKKTYCSPSVDVIELASMVIMQTSPSGIPSNAQTTESTRMKVDSSVDW